METGYHFLLWAGKLQGRAATGRRRDLGAWLALVTNQLNKDCRGNRHPCVQMERLELRDADAAGVLVGSGNPQVACGGASTHALSGCAGYGRIRHSEAVNQVCADCPWRRISSTLARGWNAIVAPPQEEGSK